MQKLGAHMSISGGHHNAVDAALTFEMTALQIFTKNASRWEAKPIPPEGAEKFREVYAASGIGALVAHDSYLINMATPDDVLWKKSQRALLDELDRCDQLAVPYLVSHPGGHMGSGEDVGVARVAHAINAVLDARPEGKAMILLETTAGQGTHLGRTFEEIAGMIDQVEDKSRVGVCLDTCHIFAAGYDIRDEATFLETVAAFDQVIGLSHLKAIHLNDSKKGLGSRVDRHAPIGEGEIGLKAFELFMNDPRLADVPGILETPKGDDGAEDGRNMTTLRGLIRSSSGTPASAD